VPGLLLTILQPDQQFLARDLRVAGRRAFLVIAVDPLLRRETAAALPALEVLVDREVAIEDVGPAHTVGQDIGAVPSGGIERQLLARRG
jgi:hypothetical protein